MVCLPRRGLDVCDLTVYFLLFKELREFDRRAAEHASAMHRMLAEVKAADMKPVVFSKGAQEAMQVGFWLYVHGDGP